MEKTGRKKNIRYIDYAKAFLIITVVFDHINFAVKDFKPWAAAFNMPAFLFISGMLFKTIPKRDFSSAKDLLVRKFQGIMIPYFIWNVILTLPSAKNILKILYGSHEMIRSAGGFLASQLWFLPALFTSCVLFIIVQLIFGDKLIVPVKIALATVSVIIGAFVPRLGTTGWPWCVNLSFIGFGFMMLGKLLFPAIQRLREYTGKSNKGKVICILICILSFAGTLLYKFNIPEIGYVLVGESIYGNYVLFVLLGCNGIAFTMLLSVLLDVFIPEGKEGGFAPLTFIGQNTLCILALHKVFIREFGRLFEIFPVGRIPSLLITGFGTILLCLPVILFIKSYIPVLTGKVTRNN